MSETRKPADGSATVATRCWSVWALASLCLVLPSCLPDWPPPGVIDVTQDDDVSGDDDASGDDDSTADDDVTGDDDSATTPLDWVPLTGATFDMGTIGGNLREQPCHAVTVTDFEILRTEVTLEQYTVCETDGGCSPPTGESGQCNWGRPGRELHPVNCVVWQQAVEFCLWAGGRLPSEAEWEFAARGQGQEVTYPWGEDPANCDRAVMDDTGTGGDGCGQAGTDVVCSHSPDGDTAQGLCDMAGNVFEWVQDLYHDTYEGAPADGTAWETGGDGNRAHRGGSCHNDAGKLRTRARNNADPLSDVPGAGFRCVRAP